jgi:hypothetical protein
MHVRAARQKEVDVSKRFFMYGGVALFALLCALFLLIRADDNAPAASSSSTSKRPAIPGQPARRHSGGDARAASFGASPAAPERAPTEEELIAAATVTSIAPQPEPGAAPEPVLPPGNLPPPIESERRRAVEQWKAQARGLLGECARGEDRRTVDVQVRFTPAPRAAGVTEQVVRAEWVAAPLEALRTLADKHDPLALQACLQRARKLSFRVPLSGEALAHAFPASLERFSIAL